MVFVATFYEIIRSFHLTKKVNEIRAHLLTIEIRFLVQNETFLIRNILPSYSTNVYIVTFQYVCGIFEFGRSLRAYKWDNNSRGIMWKDVWIYMILLHIHIFRNIIQHLGFSIPTVPFSRRYVFSFAAHIAYTCMQKMCPI